MVVYGILILFVIVELAMEVPLWFDTVFLVLLFLLVSRAIVNHASARNETERREFQAMVRGESIPDRQSLV